MERKRDGFVPIGDFALDLPDVPVPARRQARHHFTQLDQVTQLVAAPHGIALTLDTHAAVKRRFFNRIEKKRFTECRNCSFS